jgi:uncharacterized protein DUF4157
MLSRSHRQTQHRAPPPCAATVRDNASAKHKAGADAGNQALQRHLKAGALRAKLAIGSDNAPEEREADRIADSIMSGSAAAACCSTCADDGGTLRRKPNGGAGAVTARGDVFGGGRGRPLDAGTRAFFEPHFGDLSNVRIHHGEEAAVTADSIHARAYTAGRDIGFARGEYAPENSEGRKLIAHELAHVAQGADGAIRRKPRKDDMPPVPKGPPKPISLMMSPSEMCGPHGCFTDEDEKKLLDAAQAELDAEAKAPKDLSDAVKPPGAQPHFMTPETMREWGIDPSPLHKDDANFQSPTVGNEIVTIDDNDDGRTMEMTPSALHAMPSYVDNGIVSVGAVLDDFWIASISTLILRYTNKHEVRLSVRELGFADTTRSSKFVKRGGIIYPLHDDGSLAINEQNTPAILYFARLKARDQAWVRGFRAKTTITTFTFQMDLASLAMAGTDLPEGEFVESTLPERGLPEGGIPEEIPFETTEPHSPYRFASEEAWSYSGRDIRVVETPQGPRAFYRRSGGGDLMPGARPGEGGTPGEWVPFEGFYGNGDFAKPENAVAANTPNNLFRFGTEENVAISEWIANEHERAPPNFVEVGDSWGLIQERLVELGVPVRNPLAP